MNIWQQLVSNHILMDILTAWILAQFLKVPIHYLKTRQMKWAMWFSVGGMPSSHSALVTSAALSAGINEGFNTAVFAIALTLAMVVVYDSMGIRRQAGFHAQQINLLVEELLSGHPVSDKRLKEVLGHTPREVVGGVALGILIPLFFLFLRSIP
jgi:acid phosphatase family membrane protein YuiD